MTLMLCLTFCLSAMAQMKNFIDQPYIEVIGRADTLVTPNLIYIKIVIAEKDTKDKISLEEQENKMVKAFKSMGINTETDLTASDMLSNYKSYLLKQKDILKTKEYMLKVTTAETASKVFIKLEDLGISNVSIDRVDHSDIDEIKNICRINAIKDSHKKAIALTKPLLQTIGNAIHITDDDPMQYAARAYKVEINEDLDEELPKIDFEKIRVSATVSVKYILK